MGFETNTHSKEAFDGFFEQRESIGASLGFEPEWQRLDGKKMTRVGLSDSFDVTDEARWADCYEWLDDKLCKLNQTFRPLVKDL